MRSYDSYEAIIPYMRAVAEACLCNIGALIIRIGFRGPLYYNHNKKPPK